MSYFHLRWRVLRAPWRQPRGSERDALDAGAMHFMACDSRGRLLGVARLHRLDGATAQIRYMAVRPACRGHGIGQALLHTAERAAKLRGGRVVVLNARTTVAGFYAQYGYRIDGTGSVLFGVIEHVRMAKVLDRDRWQDEAVT